MDVRSLGANSKYNTAYVKAQRDIYDNGRGFLKKYWSNELEDIKKLRNFITNLPNQKEDRTLTPEELYQLFNIIIDAKTIPTHLSDEVFSNLKNWFGRELIKNLLQLKSKNKLDQANFNMVVTHQNPEKMTAAILVLSEKAELDVPQNRERLYQARDPELVIKELQAQDSLSTMLQKVGLNLISYTGSTDNFSYDTLHSAMQKLASKVDLETALAHAEPVKMAAALTLLNNYAQLNTKDNREKAASAKDPENWAQTLIAKFNVLSLLRDTEVDTEQDTSQVSNHTNLIGLNKALERFRPRDFTRKKFSAVAQHSNPESMAVAIRFLEDNPELNPEKHWESACKAVDPEKYLKSVLARRKILEMLAGAGIGSQPNRELLNTHTDLVLLQESLKLLSDFGFLTDENYHYVHAHSNPTSMSMALAILHCTHKVTGRKDILDKIELVKQEDDPKMQAIALVVQMVMDYVQASSWLSFIIKQIGAYFNADFMQFCDGLIKEAFANSINFSQNTHVESVHRSVSESAKHLLKRYEKSLVLETQIKEIKKWSENRSDAVQFAVKKLTDEKVTYYDPATKITLRKLLALTWLAIHDGKTLAASLATAPNDEEVIKKALKRAEKSFADGLLEIARGNNLDANGRDDNNVEHKDICYSGAFNKLIEKLDGIHPDASVVYITLLSAGWKLPCVVQEEVFNLLSNPKSAQELDFSQTKLNEIGLNGNVECVWERIKDKVAERMLDEFGSLFREKEKDPKFIELIAQGANVEFKKIKELGAQLTKSQAYRDKVSQANTKDEGIFRTGVLTKSDDFVTIDLGRPARLTG